MSPDHFGNEVETLERKINGGKNSIKWDWGKFESTEGFPVDDNLINWTIGQDQALKECFLCLDEWVRKLKWLEEKKLGISMSKFGNEITILENYRFLIKK